MKNLKVMMMILCMTVALCGCGGFSEGLEDGMNAAQSQEESKDESKEESQEETSQETETQEQTETETEESQPEETPEADPEEQAAESINVLMTAPVTEHDVKNGTKTEVIGTWAEIVVAKELLQATTMEEFVEFCNEVVEDSGYNWVTISCDDGTGIQFQGAMTMVATYGTLDNEGCIVDAIGTIMIQDDGTYSYSENE